ncbi:MULTISPECIES: helix-turn-helix domain-containing protein [Brachybacterium]|uniref:Helix-turn-helix domain-containing protein n=2 Tax=Brachybacterium TaxID=43668 RepID=A0A3R8RXT5_9MICO|nr:MULTISPECIES: helix-turn-helix domain-containing protein [Brachybacterium]RRR18282.1 hypothetical protein DS079_11085 [Brachybacterium paraconglomeratum]GLI30393.1 hypothetical protein BCONGLO52_12340 [Brachybacterium conglomeratum]GLK04932.1 hypothetical protein GCM10017597_17320 [Brachybacterium conglomeratum]
MTTKHLTTVEVAEILRCSKYSVRRYVQRGLLPAVQIMPGTTYLIPADAVDALLAEHVQHPEPEAVELEPAGPLMFSPRNARSSAQAGRRRGRAA